MNIVLYLYFSINIEFNIILLILWTTTTQMKVNRMNPPTMCMKQEKLMIPKYCNRIYEGLLNYSTVNCKTKSSSPILTSHKYRYQYLNHNIKFRIKSISNILIFKLYVSQPPTNMVRMCTIAKVMNPIK